MRIPVFREVVAAIICTISCLVIWWAAFTLGVGWEASQAAIATAGGIA